MNNFREKAASLVLCNSNIKEALELLDDASETIPEEVMVCQKFENDPIEDVIEYIETIEAMLKEAYEEGLKIAKL